MVCAILGEILVFFAIIFTCNSISNLRPNLGMMFLPTFDELLSDKRCKLTLLLSNCHNSLVSHLTNICPV